MFSFRNVMQVVVVLALAIQSARAADAILLSDINTGFAGASSSPQNFIDVGGKCFFVATDGTNGFELYISDGFASGTKLVRDIFSGPGSSSPSNMTNFGGVLFFTANDGSSGNELWKSDGTSAGTVLVKDIQVGPGSSNPSGLIVLSGVLYFSADDGINGRELWKTDGTTAGTVMVKDINPGNGNGIATNTKFTIAGTSLVFPAHDGVSGIELWKSDGTTAGTVLVKDFNTTAATGGLTANNEIVVVGTDVYLPATDSSNDRELYRVLGSDLSTTTKINLSAGSSSPANLIAVGSTLYCTATVTAGRTDLVSVTGVIPTTVLLNGTTSPSPSLLTNVNGVLYCRANYNPSGTACGVEVVRVVGSIASLCNVTASSTGIAVGSFSSSPTNFTAVGSTLLVSANDNVNGTEIWSISGTLATLAKDINTTSATASSLPSNFKVLDATHAVFTANSGTSGIEPYIWNAGVVSLLRDINPGSDSSSSFGFTLVNLAVGGPTLFFSANDGFGTELFKTDGVTTIRVKDLNTSANSSDAAQLTDFNGTLFFRAQEATQGYELYKSNGTPAGTVLANDLLPGSDSSYPDYLKVFNGGLYFYGADPTNGFELQKSDGTTVTNVADLEPGAGSSSVYELQVSNGKLYYYAYTNAFATGRMFVNDGATNTVINEGSSPPYTYNYPFVVTPAGANLFFVADTIDNTATDQGYELWHVTGTTASLVKDINPTPGFSSGYPQNLVAMGNTLFFTADDSVHGNELWKSDGTGAGTVLVKDIVVGTGASDPANLTVVGGTLYFTANDGVNGIELWKSDGTDAGTVLVKDIFPGSVGSNPHSLTNLNGTLLFAAADGVNGFELWKSDGTAAGTVLVKDINPGSGSSMPPIGLTVPILAAGGAGRAVFSATNGTSGTELWKTDGTAAGTVQIQDINPGSGSSTPDQYTISGQFVYFTANNGSQGTELWALALSTLLDPPVITTLPVAVGAAGTAFNFQIGLTGTDPITVTSTDLPAGLVLSGSTISGVPTTAGTFTTTITATNSSGTATQTLTIIVTGDGVSNSVVDTDGDGFSDEIETALGTDPKNGAMTPFNGMAAGVVLPLNVQKLAISLNFTKPTLNDSIAFSGLIGLPMGFVSTGKTMTFSVGGVVKTFTLDVKGQITPKSKTDVYKLAYRTNSPVDQLGKYALKFSKGTFASALVDEGFVKTVTVKEALKSINVSLIFNGRLYSTSVTQLYSATANKSGKTSQPTGDSSGGFPTR